jgi:hypothetical protein
MSLAILLGKGGKTIVLVAYSDETGTEEMGTSPITVVTAVLMNMDTQWPAVARRMEEIEPLRHREIKGRKLFKDLRNRRRCDEANRTLTNVLSMVFVNRLPVFQGAVRRRYVFDIMKRIQAHKTTPHDLAFAICLHRVDSWVRAAFPKEQVVWISDNAGHYEQKITNAMANWRQNAKSGLSLREIMPQALHIADTVYFGDSKTSRALQIADVCCSTIREHFLNNPSAQPYFDILRPQMQNDNMPYPEGAVV